MLGTWFSSVSHFMPLSRVANWWRQHYVLIHAGVSLSWCRLVVTQAVSYENTTMSMLLLVFDSSLAAAPISRVSLHTKLLHPFGVGTREGVSVIGGWEALHRKGNKSFIFTRAELTRRRIRKRFRLFFVYFYKKEESSFLLSLEASRSIFWFANNLFTLMIDFSIRVKSFRSRCGSNINFYDVLMATSSRVIFRTTKAVSFIFEPLCDLKFNQILS